MITAARLALLEPRIEPGVAASLAAALDVALSGWSPAEVAAFIGQTAYETDGFRRFEENLRYTHADRLAAIWPRLAGRASKLLRNPEALANAAYAGRNGNGDEASGDGWRFRGRGLLEITGRSNYAAASRDLGVDLVADPDQVAKPEFAVKTALWFWRSRGCGDAAIAGDIDAVTRLINGPAMAGEHARRDLVAACRKIFV